MSKVTPTIIGKDRNDVKNETKQDNDSKGKYRRKQTSNIIDDTSSSSDDDTSNEANELKANPRKMKMKSIKPSKKCNPIPVIPKIVIVENTKNVGNTRKAKENGSKTNTNGKNRANNKNDENSKKKKKSNSKGYELSDSESSSDDSTSSSGSSDDDECVFQNSNSKRDKNNEEQAHEHEEQYTQEYTQEYPAQYLLHLQQQLEQSPSLTSLSLSPTAKAKPHLSGCARTEGYYKSRVHKFSVPIPNAYHRKMAMTMAMNNYNNESGGSIDYATTSTPTSWIDDKMGVIGIRNSNVNVNANGRKKRRCFGIPPHLQLLQLNQLHQFPVDPLIHGVNNNEIPVGIGIGFGFSFGSGLGLGLGFDKNIEQTKGKMSTKSKNKKDESKDKHDDERNNRNGNGRNSRGSRHGTRNGTRNVRSNGRSGIGIGSNSHDSGRPRSQQRSQQRSGQTAPLTNNNLRRNSRALRSQKRKVHANELEFHKNLQMRSTRSRSNASDNDSIISDGANTFVSNGSHGSNGSNNSNNSNNSNESNISNVSNCTNHSHGSNISNKSDISNISNASNNSNDSNETHITSMSNESRSTISNFNTLNFRTKNLRFDKSSIHSWGVYAMEDIMKNEMVIEYIGEYISNPLSDRREKVYHELNCDDYFFRVDKNRIIDATKCGNMARFINHSCDPNCYTKIINVSGSQRVVIYSKKDIKKGDELTYDYQFEIEQTGKIKCLCGAKDCRGTLN